MTLFVGGPRHGAWMETQEKIFVDVGSGSRYVREPANFTVLNDVTQRPQWTYTVEIMVHESIVDLYACNTCNGFVPPNHHETAAGAGHRDSMVYQPRGMYLQQQVQDAALRDLFYRTGIKSKATGALPPSAPEIQGNGAGTPPHKEPVEIFLMSCETCDNDVDHSFPTAVERADAARFHLELNPGHVFKFDTERIDG